MAVTDPPKIVTARMGHPDSHTLERYLATGGYDGLRKALTMTPEGVAQGVLAVVSLPRGTHVTTIELHPEAPIAKGFA